MEFRAKSGSGSAKTLFWSLPRVAYLLVAALSVNTLIAQIIFTVYWLIVDFNGIFLVEIIRYIELFHFYSLTFYLTALTMIKILQLNVLNG